LCFVADVRDVNAAIRSRRARERDDFRRTRFLRRFVFESARKAERAVAHRLVDEHRHRLNLRRCRGAIGVAHDFLAARLLVARSRNVHRDRIAFEQQR
jgi:hypothetical protein